MREQANSERKTTVTPPLPERNPKIEYVNDGGWIVPRRKAKPTGWKTTVTKNGKRPTSKPTGWETTVYTKPWGKILHIISKDKYNGRTRK